MTMMCFSALIGCASVLAAFSARTWCLVVIVRISHDLVRLIFCLRLIVCLAVLCRGGLIAL
ncbi:hypothetical protein F4779DRAFT_577667 [Xylariaceae sp. FL0662B]|nr:hypothetical protein F4779DRAFT_577667 [Xylariaceae sp. FL0662B]